MKPLLIDTPFQEWNIKGLPVYRNKQIRKWIYEKGILDFEEMSNLPLEVRKDLGNEWDLRPMELVRVQGSQDTTSVAAKSEASEATVGQTCWRSWSTSHSDERSAPHFSGSASSGSKGSADRAAARSAAGDDGGNGGIEFH